jgi:hypothetical protein
LENISARLKISAKPSIYCPVTLIPILKEVLFIWGRAIRKPAAGMPVKLANWYTKNGI